MQLTSLATFAVLAGTLMRGLSVQRWPLGNMYEFAIVAASFALVVFCTWSLKQDRRWLGPFVVLPVMVVLVAGKIWYTEASQLMPALDNTMWLTIHVTLATLSVALFVIGAALAVTYLLRDAAERKSRVRGWLAALPQAEKLEAMTYGMHIFAFPLWTFTLITGAIWAEVAWGRYWGWDPRRSGPSSSGSCTPPTCTRAPPAAGPSGKPPTSRSPACSASSSTTPWSTCSSPASTPTPAWRRGAIRGDRLAWGSFVLGYGLSLIHI